MAVPDPKAPSLTKLFVRAIGDAKEPALGRAILGAVHACPSVASITVLRSDRSPGGDLTLELSAFTNDYLQARDEIAANLRRLGLRASMVRHDE
jgi:hypothetical protein